MINYLLDTHVLLWSLHDDQKLSESARQIVLDSTLKKYVSVVSLWEISIKNRVGKLLLARGMSDIYDEIENNGFGIIGINRNCIEIYNTLPLIHRDPFDGMIIATAILDKMTIITADENIQGYNIHWIW